MSDIVIACTGPRVLEGFNSFDLYAEMVRLLRWWRPYAYERIYTGGAYGFDTLMKRASLDAGFREPVEIRPDPSGNGIPDWARCLARNSRIIHHADLLIALNPPSQGGGTRDTVDKAIKKGIPLIVRDLDGLWWHEAGEER